ncbi:MAG: flagellar hook-length control protein FliK [Deltaproteobacteria bacterium]|jgi:flagellar hook-length control protein FliK|nr:flagellar hook-length control protein FliK [Deltaproteobacteria bacterium]
MQFLPDSLSSGVSALGGVDLSLGRGISLAAAKGNAFLETLNEQLAGAGISPIADPLAKGDLPGGFRTIKRDVSANLDNEDVSLIIATLKKRGVNDSVLSGIEGLLANGQTPTVGTILGAVGKQQRASGDITDEDYELLLSAFQKLQFSQDESEELLDLMREGRGGETMRTIRDRAANMGENALSLTRGEVGAIMRGLDLSENALKKVVALLGGDADAVYDSAALEKLFGPATTEFAAKKAEAEKLAAEIRDVVNETLRLKKAREATESVADTRGSRKTDRAETRMLDDLTAKANGELRTRNGLDADRGEEEAALADQEREQRKNAPENRRKATVQTNDKDNAASGAEKASRTRDGFSAVADRIDAAPGLTLPTQGAMNAARPEAVRANPNQQAIFSQVEQGMLRQLQDGSRQMTLRLDPAELGQITLLLTVKGGEVRALIRADNPETTSLLSEQMSQLRSSLEEQGLKVAQLDVETRLPADTTKDQWSGMEGFNQEQEMREQARFLQLARLRRESGTALAQDMQNRDMREEISPAGLHVIA